MVIEFLTLSLKCEKILVSGKSLDRTEVRDG